MEAALRCTGLIGAMAPLLDTEEPEASRVVVDILIKLCCYSDDSYRTAVKVRTTPFIPTKLSSCSPPPQQRVI